MRCLWQERNNCHFEGCERTSSNLKLFIKSFYEWLLDLDCFSFPPYWICLIIVLFDLKLDVSVVYTLCTRDIFLMNKFCYLPEIKSKKILTMNEKEQYRILVQWFIQSFRVRYS